MPFWDEPLHDSSIFKSIQSIEAAHDAAAATAAENPVASKQLGRLRAVIAGARISVEAVDPLMVPEPAVAAIASSLAPWLTEITNFTGNGDATHLVNAQAHANAALISLAQIPVNPVLLKKGAIATTIQSLVRTIEERENAITADRVARDAQVAEAQAAREAVITEERAAERIRLDKLTADISELTAQVATTRTEVVTLVNTHQQQFSTAQETRVSEFAKVQDDRAREYLAALTATKDETARVIKAKTGELELVISDGSARVQAWSETGDKLLSDRDSALSARIETMMTALNVKKIEADDLVGLIGERGVTSNYQKIANSARTEMIVWHLLTMTALAVFVLVAIFEFVPALQAGWNWGLFAGRFFVATALALFAGYAGAQAKGSGDVMRKNRQREMDLKAIGPYISTLSEEQQQQIKVAFANRTFIAPEEPASKGDGAGNALSDPKLQEVAISVVKTALTEFAKSK
jgi:hypothetical protein